MARITIIGGHGKVALDLGRLLAQRGDTVSAVIRSESQVADVERTGANAVVADVQELDTDTLAGLLRGQDAVVWSAGAGGGDPQRTYAVDRDAAIRSMDAARAAGVGRYVMVSYMGAGQDHGVDRDDPFYAYAQSKADADEHLRASSLEWTILGPGALTDEDPSGRITVGRAGDTGGRETARGNVALVASAVLDAPETTAGKTVEFADGDTPVQEAVAALT